MGGALRRSAWDGSMKQDLLGRIRKKLGHLTHEAKPTMFLNSGNKFLNSVLGHPDKGLAYGKILEIYGKESNGKTALAIDIACLCQTDGAVVIWIDLEHSFDPEWIARRGLKIDDVILIQPYVGKFNKGKETRLSTVQELLEEAEATMTELQRSGIGKFCLVIDSVAAMLVEEEAEAGLTGQNLRTGNALPVALGRLLRRWIGLLQDYHALAVFINQMRTKPGVPFGDPDYTPGGNALRFYAHIRVRMRRVKGGRMTQSGKVIGIKGILKNDKNKGGGVEGTEIGFKIFFNGKSRFLSAATIREEADK